MKPRLPLVISSVLPVFLSAPSVLACAACYGQSDSAMAQGMNWGIFTLLGVIGLVLLGVSTFFVFLIRRAAAMAVEPGTTPPFSDQVLTMEFMYKLLGLPEVASAHGGKVDSFIVYVHWLMAALFVGWFIYFVFTLYRFRQRRNPSANYFGVRNHASSYIEFAVVGVEAFLLLFLAIPLWGEVVGKFPKESESTVIQVVAQQFAWNARYGGADGEFGTQDMKFVSNENIFGVDPADPQGRDDVQVLNEIHVPVNKPVIAFISSKDVIHSFRIVAMRTTQDAIPGMRIPTWFKPTKTGSYQIYCAQLCGNGHAAMAGGRLIVESQSDYDKWLAARSGATMNFE